jgi:predicted DNA repair protein MutK
MASSFFALFDDIASVLDDVAVLSKVAAKKTSGVLGDDLALNAEQVAGVQPSRELPVVWAVAKGSAINKVILVPSALLISVFASFLIKPLLMLGGAFLAFEGFEKVLHALTAKKEAIDAEHHAHLEKLQQNDEALLKLESTKIKGAVRTDFILSAEIIVITLGTVAGEPLTKQILVLIVMAVLMTVGVYGLVAGIVKLDDIGLHLNTKRSAMGIERLLGRALLLFAPKLMKSLSIIGTIAMFLVGGGILVHGFSPLHHLLTAWSQILPDVSVLLMSVFEGLVALLVGALIATSIKTIGLLTKRKI